jgi:hypothetical protein
MSGFLARLAQRQLEPPPAQLRPRAVSRFAARQPDAPATEEGPRVLPSVPQSRPQVQRERPEPPASDERAEQVLAPMRARPARQSTEVAATPASSARGFALSLPQPPRARDESPGRGESRGNVDVEASHAGVVPVTPAAAPDVAAPEPPVPLVPRRAPPASEEPLRAGPRPDDGSSDLPPPRAIEATRDEHVVRVTIGRVEVRAVLPPPREKREAPRPRTLSLDEYLERRHGARR